MAKSKDPALKEKSLVSAFSLKSTQEVKNVPKPVESTQKPYLLFMSGVDLGRLHPLNFEKEEFLIGRANDCDLRLDSPGISRHHAVLRYQKGEPVELIDLNSKNGSYIKGKRIKSHYLLPYEKFRLGPQLLLKFLYIDEEDISFFEQMYSRIAYDSLTGILNRRHFFEILKREFSFAIRHQSLLAVAMLDIDFFKKINDTFGHPVGDRVLQEFARRIRSSIRHEDLFARYGGEEFVVLLRDIGGEGAAVMAERMRRAISSTPFLIKNYTLHVTVSIGLVVCPCGQRHHPLNPEFLLSIADSLLYKAKRTGRNRVVLSIHSD